MVDLLTELQQAHRESPSWRLYGLCHQAATRIAELEAENERLTKALSEQIDRDISGIFPGERALAERAGGVRFVGNIPGSSSASGFAPLTTEPAAPKCPQCDFGLGGHEPGCPAASEGRQEAVAYLSSRVLSSFDPNGAEIVDAMLFPKGCLRPNQEVAIYTRPAEQAVTEEWREIKQHVQPRIADGYTAVAISKPGYWFVKGPGPAEAIKVAMEAGR